jgi:hypothetical protein
VARSEGDKQEQAKPFELGMRMVVRLGEVYCLVVHNLVNLSKVAGTRQQRQIVRTGNFLERGQIFARAATQLVAVYSGAQIFGVVRQPIAPI